MNKRINLAGLLLALCLVGSNTLAAGTIKKVMLTVDTGCKYYAFVSYGPAMPDGNLDRKQDAYYGSGLRKYASNNFRAVYTSYNQTRLASGFKVETIGPYDTEAVAYSALTTFIDDLELQGFLKKSSRHTFPAVILRNAEKCD